MLILLIIVLSTLFCVRSSINVQNHIIWPTTNSYTNSLNPQNASGYVYMKSNTESHINIIYFHGNIGSVYRAQKRISSLQNIGNIYLIEYPCYSQVCPLTSLNPETFWPYVTKLVKQLIEDINKESSQEIILYGRSIGTGVVGEILTRDSYISNSISTIILETPFTSINDIFINMVGETVATILGDQIHWPLDNLNNFAHVNKGSEILIIAGDDDKLTPVKQAKKLHESMGNNTKLIIKSKQTHRIPFHLIYDDILQFLNMK